MIKQIGAVLFVVGALFLVACGERPSTQERITQNLTEKGIYTLSPEEAQRALNQARAYFERAWAMADGQRGSVDLCRPTDSNSNGLVTCQGWIPTRQKDGSVLPVKTTMYCGYRVEIQNCSDQDTVAGGK